MVVFFSRLNIEAQTGHMDSLQSLSFTLKGKYERPIKKETICESKLISEVIPGYPVNWISSYTSVEIQSLSAEKTMKAISTTDTLNTEQKNLLKMVDVGTDLIFKINYSYNTPVTHTIENNELFTTLTIIPEKEAEYIGGNNQMKNYISESGINKIPKETIKEFRQAVIHFTIDTDGKIVEASIIKTSGNSKTDSLLLETINQMPKWKPAETMNGLKVKQKFEFTVNGINPAGC